MGLSLTEKQCLTLSVKLSQARSNFWKTRSGANHIKLFLPLGLYKIMSLNYLFNIKQKLNPIQLLGWSVPKILIKTLFNSLSFVLQDLLLNLPLGVKIFIRLAQGRVWMKIYYAYEISPGKKWSNVIFR